MSVYALMVTHNAADRYLECALTHLKPHVEGILVFDDGSNDDTVNIARRFTPWVVSRPDHVPSFLEHEGRFREAAWAQLECSAYPEPGDWVLSVDSDEVLICHEPHLPKMPYRLRGLTGWAESCGADAVELTIPEAFALDPLRIRVDAMWENIHTARLFAWRPDARWAFRDAEDRLREQGTLPPVGDPARPGAMACPAGPAGDQPPVFAPFGSVQLIHLGYADAAGRSERYERYRTRRGHNPVHVESILSEPTLREWQGPPVDVWRGVRTSVAEDR